MPDANLPRRARLVIGGSLLAGLTFTAAVIGGLVSSPAPSASKITIFVTVSILVGVTRLWPIVMYLDNESESVTLDESLLVMAVLLLPWPYAVGSFVISTAAVQAFQGRAIQKTVFNWGQVVASAGLGVLVSRVIAVPGARPGLADMAAAAVAATVFFAVNNAWMAAVVSANGTPWQAVVREGLNVRVWLLLANVAIGAMLAFAAADHAWSIVFAIVTLLILRQLITGRFQARHDRFRLLGLFRVALAANESLREDDVAAPLLASTRSLLRSNAEITSERPAMGQLGAEMLINGDKLWLIVSGRGRNEPFDAADVELLGALAAIGSGALRNAALYREIRHQQERLSAITGSLGEGVCAMDEAGFITFLNPAARRMLGWTDDSTVQPTVDFLRRPAEEVMRSPGLILAEDAAFGRYDGSTIPVELTASALVQNDRPVGAVIVFHDISERQELEARLHDSQKLEALGRLAGGVAHDFNNVLAAIALCGDLLSATVDGKALDFVSEIRTSAARAATLTDQLLTFSRSQRFAAGSADPVAVIVGMQQMLTRLIGEHIHIMTELPAVGGCFVKVDSGRIEQVVMNLVLNARDAMPDGGTLWIKVASVDLAPNQLPGVARGRYVKIVVEDTGTGMSPETRDRLFEPFFTTKAPGQGTGLGLATVAGIVSRNGGHLGVESEVGEGSTFTVLLPVASKESVGRAGPEAEPRSATVVDGATVLLVEDETPVRKAAAMILKSAGYRVLQAVDGVEGLELAAKHAERIELVVTDVLMPRLSGPAMVERLRRVAPATRVLFISGFSEDAVTDELSERSTLLRKPFSASTLLAAVSAALQGSGGST